jgi:Domain of unknown function (DUF4082)
MRLLNIIPQKTACALSLCIFLSCISCTKEYSNESPAMAGAVSIFTSQSPLGQTVNDGTGGIELGMKFRSAIAGNILGIKFYKTAGNSGTHTAQLFSTDGTLLASAVFTNETDSGWQRAIFTSAIPIAANTTYIAAYHSSLGNYTFTAYGLHNAVTNPPLTGLADGTDGINGLYEYTNTPAFPTHGYDSNNYWVDVIESNYEIY